MVAMVGHLGQIRLIVTLRDTWLQIVRFPRVSEGLNPGWIQSHTSTWFTTTRTPAMACTPASCFGCIPVISP